MSITIKKPSEPLFPNIEIEKWQAAASRELKGSNPFDALKKNWPDGLDILPVYDSANANFHFSETGKQPATLIRLQKHTLETLFKNENLSANNFKASGWAGFILSGEKKEEIHDGLLKKIENAGLGIHYQSEFAQLLNFSRAEISLNAMKGDIAAMLDLEKALNMGASPALELALAQLAISEMEAPHSTLIIQVGVSPQIFLETAKIAALRELIGKHSGVKIRITNPYLYLQSKDPWTNQLRNTSAALIAALANADEFVPQVPISHNLELAVRTAAFTLPILQFEGKLDGTANLLKGNFVLSAMIQALLDKVAEILKSLPTDKDSAMQALSEKITAERRAKENAIEHQELTIIGVNKFTTGVFEENLEMAPEAAEYSLGTELANIYTANKLAGKSLQLFCSGDIKWQRARKEFCSNYFNALGIALKEAPETNDSDMILWCADDETYAKDWPSISAQFKGRKVIIAGNPDKMDAALSTAGFHFIYKGKKMKAMNAEL